MDYGLGPTAIGRRHFEDAGIGRSVKIASAVENHAAFREFSVATTGEGPECRLRPVAAGVCQLVNGAEAGVIAGSSAVDRSAIVEDEVAIFGDRSIGATGEAVQDRLGPGADAGLADGSGRSQLEHRPATTRAATVTAAGAGGAVERSIRTEDDPRRRIRAVHSTLKLIENGRSPDPIAVRQLVNRA